MAKEFLAAVEQGKILHATHNIRESGSPLEDRVRQAFSSLMPPTFSVGHGYLFDPTSKCTPQMDLIISPSQRSHSMLSTVEGATYSPFSEAYAIGEIKASAGGIRDHLKQLAKRMADVNTMRRSLYELTQYRFPDLISLLIIGDCKDLKLPIVSERWDADPDNFPDFILLVSRGELVLKPTGQAALFFAEDSELGPTQRPDGPDLHTWAAGVRATG